MFISEENISFFHLYSTFVSCLLLHVFKIEIYIFSLLLCKFFLFLNTFIYLSYFWLH